MEETKDPAKISLKSIELAVDLAKAGMAPHTSAFLNNPEVVAKFIDILAKKIDSITS